MSAFLHAVWDLVTTLASLAAGAGLVGTGGGALAGIAAFLLLGWTGRRLLAGALAAAVAVGGLYGAGFVIGQGHCAKRIARVEAAARERALRDEIAERDEQIAELQDHVRLRQEATTRANDRAAEARAERERINGQIEELRRRYRLPGEGGGADAPVSFVCIGADDARMLDQIGR